MITKINLPINYKNATSTTRRLVREAYVSNQKDLCYHCNSSLTEQPPIHISNKQINWKLFPGGRDFLRYPVHLHHDHNTGLTIGAVHAYCNAVLWQYHGQ